MTDSEATAQAADAKLSAAHEALLKTRGMQFDFAVVPQPPPPPWLKPLIEFLQATGPVLKYVFWGGLIAGVVLIAWFLLREFVPESWFRRRRAKVEVADWRPDREQAQALLDDAERLAADGRFEEAIHLLLFRSIEDLAGRRPGAVRPALTSRDIADLEVLPQEARSAFARLAEAVERTFFGGRPAGADAFAEARDDYRAFAFAEGWR